MFMACFAGGRLADLIAWIDRIRGRDQAAIDCILHAGDEGAYCPPLVLRDCLIGGIDRMDWLHCGAVSPAENARRFAVRPHSAR
jgi:hypothetical protein